MSISWLLAKGMRYLPKFIRPRLGGNFHQYSPHPLTSQFCKSMDSNLFKYPKISIVTPSYGQADFIENTINSVLGQNYPNLEYFVQDGGSTDGTVEILKKYENQLSGWSSEFDEGQSQAINRGFANTRGEIMAWLNSDDLLLPGVLVVVNHQN